MTGEATIADASVGDRLDLSKYIKSPVTVTNAGPTMDGRVLLVESTGGTTYRLRAIDDDDDRLLMEKRDGDAWSPFIRLTADILTDD